MVLDPLTKIGIGVFMAVVIGGRQLMVHILRDGERRNDQQQQRKRGTEAERADPRQTRTSRETAH